MRWADSGERKSTFPQLGMVPRFEVSACTAPVGVMALDDSRGWTRKNTALEERWRAGGYAWLVVKTTVKGFSEPR